MIGNFFDLQRFASGVLVSGGASGFYWQNGEKFAAGGVSTSALGTADNPAYLSTAGVSFAGTADNVYFNGTEPFSFFVNGKSEWAVSIDGADNVVRATATGIDSLVGEVKLNVNGEFNETVNGEVAQIKAVGAVGVKATDDVLTYSFDSIAAGSNVVANNVSITAVDDLAELGVTRGGASDISVINVSGPLGKELRVNGDTAFSVVAGSATYDVAADLPDNNLLAFDATASRIALKVSDEETYNVTGGQAVFNFTDAMKAGETTDTTLNGAAVGINAGSEFATDTIVARANAESEAGISDISNLRPGDSINVANDSDGFVANFDAPEAGGNYTYAVNAASINADNSGQAAVSFSVGADTTSVTIGGLKDTEVTVAAGATYYFKDGTTPNKVTANDETYVTLDSAGNVGDYMDSSSKAKNDNDEKKWDNVSSIGGGLDSVATDHSNTLDKFYDLANSDAAALSVASYTGDASVAADTVANATGYTFYARNGELLGTAGHVTLSAGTAVGGRPINIQANESASIFDVTIDLTNSNTPSTIAVGTTGNVAASHEVSLSNAGIGYAYLGAGATGQNRIFAGIGGAQIRHSGGVRATIQGNVGDDTIWGASNDLVNGGGGADQFYDSASYTIQDYNAAAGDAIIATRINSVDDITKAKVVQGQGDTGNQIGFGRKTLTLGTDQNSSLNVKVAVMDTDAKVVATKNVVLAGVNGGAVDASGLDAGGLIIADEDRNGNSADNVTGSAYADDIYVGANDFVNGGAGDDVINIGSIPAGDAGAQVVIGSGNDTVVGWTQGFDPNSGATKFVSGSQVTGRFYNDRLMMYNETGSVLLEGTERGANHGQWEVLVEEDGVEKKFMAIRTYDENTRSSVSAYGYVASNADIADYYLAERDGLLMFGSDVTADLGWIDLASEKYQAITTLALGNNSNASLVGSDKDETILLGGNAVAGAQKAVSVGGGNDYITSGGDGTVSAGHKLFFGQNDGRDTIAAFSHYLGVDVDGDKQYADTLVLEGYTGLKVERSAGGDRIEIGSGDNSRVVIYETGDNAVNVNNMYRMQIGFGPENVKVAKIGFSDAANNFTYDKKVSYYVGNSGEKPNDTLTIADTSENVEVWLDGSRNGGEFYRGVAVIDATAETNTNLSLVGGNHDDTINAGGVGTRNFMWGGTGDDVLNGGTGIDYFMYYKNSGAYLQGADAADNGGNDVVNGYDFDNDVIWLGDVTLDDIKANGSTGISESGINLEFNNGGSLTVNTNSDKVRVFANNGSEVFVADKESGTWSREA